MTPGTSVPGSDGQCLSAATLIPRPGPLQEARSATQKTVGDPNGLPLLKFAARRARGELGQPGSYLSCQGPGACFCIVQATTPVGRCDAGYLSTLPGGVNAASKLRSGRKGLGVSWSNGDAGRWL